MSKSEGMFKEKNRYIVTGAALGMIFGYALWSVAGGMVLGAAIGLVVYTFKEKKESE